MVVDANGRVLRTSDSSANISGSREDFFKFLSPK
jgi:hypothetical protein